MIATSQKRIHRKCFALQEQDLDLGNIWALTGMSPPQYINNRE